MQLQAMTYFIELIRCRSIRRAGQNLGVSPTAISRQLDNLEYFFGTQLVVRGARGIELTAAGEVVAEQFNSANRAIDHARQFVEDLRGLRRGHVGICVNGAASGSVLSASLARFSAEYPAITFSVDEPSASAALDRVASGEADLSLTMFSPADGRIKVKCWRPISYCGVLAPFHPAAGRELLSLEELCQHPLSLPDTSFSLRQAISDRFAKSDFSKPPVAFETSSLTVQKELARLGACILVLPAISVQQDLELGRLVLRPLADEARIDTDLQLGVAKERPMSFAAEKFAQFLERQLVAL